MTHSGISEILTGKRPALDHDTKVVINMIFARFHHIYTHRFESAYGDETTLNQAKREWALSLAGTDPRLVELALERCKKEHAWPPTIAEFLKLLAPLPQDIGLPALDVAYAEACRQSYQPDRHTWSHICVQLAAQGVGYFTLRSQPEKNTKPAFAREYQKLVEQLVRGETIEVKKTITLPEPDFSAEEALVTQLVDAGVNQAVANNMAYYQQKPAYSDVRKRYRDRAQLQLKTLNIDFDLPD